MISIKIKGLNNVSKELSTKFNSSLESSKNNIIKQLVNELKDNTPVDTGHARDSWTSNSNSITNDADYISELNAGSSKQAPSHFVEKTLLAHSGIKPNGVIVKSK